MIETFEQLLAHIKEEIGINEKDLGKTTEEDMASFYEGKIEAYEDCLIKLQYLMEVK